MDEIKSRTEYEKNQKEVEELCELVKRLSKEFPTLRFGQLLVNVVDDQYLYFIPNDKLKIALEYFYDPKNGRVQ